MKTTKTLLSLLLALSLCLALCACAAAEEPAFDAELPVRVMTLNGTTGFGMAGLIAAAQADEAALNYSFSVETDASNITAASSAANATSPPCRPTPRPPSTTRPAARSRFSRSTPWASSIS